LTHKGRKGRNKQQRRKGRMNERGEKIKCKEKTGCNKKYMAAEERR
jgi:hypothetical protein